MHAVWLLSAPALAQGELAQELLPSVSITTVTNSRPEFVEHALRQIADSAYPAALIKEVVVVDDSPAPLRAQGLHAGTQRHGGLTVHYVPLDHQASVGEKRNIAAARASGTVVMHWDDDDLYGPQRIYQQVLPIARGEADITVLPHTLTYFMDDDRLMSAKGGSWGPHFGTLTYRQNILSHSRFVETSEAEDYNFAQQAVNGGARIHVLPASAPAAVQPAATSPAATALSARERRAAVLEAEAMNTTVLPSPSNATAPLSPPLFVCVRHGSNTWQWDPKGTAAKFDLAGRELPSTMLRQSDREFAQRLRSSGLFGELASRRAASPTPSRYVHPSTDRGFFNHLFAEPAEGVRDRRPLSLSYFNESISLSYFQDEDEQEGGAGQPRRISYFDTNLDRETNLARRLNMIPSNESAGVPDEQAAADPVDSMI
jgi:hypothetical protein